MVFISLRISLEIHYTNTFHFINYKTITPLYHHLNIEINDANNRHCAQSTLLGYLDYIYGQRNKNRLYMSPGSQMKIEWPSALVSKPHQGGKNACQDFFRGQLSLSHNCIF